MSLLGLDFGKSGLDQNFFWERKIFFGQVARYQGRSEGRLVQVRMDMDKVSVFVGSSRSDLDLATFFYFFGDSKSMVIDGSEWKKSGPTQVQV